MNDVETTQYTKQDIQNMLNKNNCLDVNKLRKFVTERGKILPRRITGTSAKAQRKLTLAIKRSRNIALLPYVVD